jgi:rhodanese-related sulfurtransferase
MAENPSAPVPLEISVEEARDLLAAHPLDTALIDVREPSEHETARIPGSAFVPMRRIPEHVPQGLLAEKESHLTRAG